MKTQLLFVVCLYVEIETAFLLGIETNFQMF